MAYLVVQPLSHLILFHNSFTNEGDRGIYVDSRISLSKFLFYSSRFPLYKKGELLVKRLKTYEDFWKVEREKF